jgi:hypothetical protein
MKAPPRPLAIGPICNRSAKSEKLPGDAALPISCSMLTSSFATAYKAARETAK